MNSLGQDKIDFNLEIEPASLLLPAVRKEKLPTNSTTRHHPVHRWFNFVAGFSPEFVSECVDALPKGRRNSLLDPFTGCATAQVEGIRNGMVVAGYEPHPVFVRIARAKTSFVNDVHRLNRIANVIRRGLNLPCDPISLGVKPEAFLIKLFDKNILSSLIGSRNAIFDSEFKNDDMAFLILSKILEHTSHSQTDGIYKAPTSMKKAKNPLLALELIVTVIREDLEVYHNLQYKNIEVNIYSKSCEFMEEIQSQSVDLIVTSPPYLNNFDFAEMTRMLLYFWSMASNWSDITDRVRSRLIVNTTTALRGQKEKQVIYKKEITSSLYITLDNIVRDLEEMRLIKAGKKDYNFLIYPYFAQIGRALRESLRTMRKGAKFNMIVADSALYGVHIPTPQIIANIMEELGFCSVKLLLIRTRGERWLLDKRDGSALGLGEYHISAESSI